MPHRQTSTAPTAIKVTAAPLYTAILQVYFDGVYISAGWKSAHQVAFIFCCCKMATLVPKPYLGPLLGAKYLGGIGAAMYVLIAY